MTCGDTVWLEVTLEVLTSNTGLDAGHVVLLVDPLDLVHSAHVHRDDHSLLIDIEHEGLCDVGATSVWDKDNVVLASKLDKGLTVLVAVWIDDHVCDLWNLLVSELPHFLNAGTMGVHDSLPLVEGASREAGGSELSDELVVKVWSFDLHVSLLCVSLVKLDSKVGLGPWSEGWKVLSSEHVPVSLDLDSLLVSVVVEARVAVAPPLPVEEVELDLTGWVVVNDSLEGLAINDNVLLDLVFVNCELLVYRS